MSKYIGSHPTPKYYPSKTVWRMKEKHGEVLNWRTKMHLQDHVGQRLRLSLCLRFLQLLLHGRVSGNGDIRLPEVFAIRKSADLLGGGEWRRCWHREARFTGNLRRAVSLGGKNRRVRASLLIRARVCCWNNKEQFTRKHLFVTRTSIYDTLDAITIFVEKNFLVTEIDIKNFTCCFV